MQLEDKATILLEVVVVESFKALSHLVFCECRAPYPLTVSMRSVVGAWEVTRKAEIKNDRVLSPQMPLWKNPQLSHFYCYPDSILWTKFVIKTVGSVVGN